MPKHIAIIMDGNGRWAEQQKKPRTFGHKAGVSTLRETIKHCLEFKIKHLSVYAFSTENWKRPEKEVTFLLKLLATMINKELPHLIEQNIKVKIIGETHKLNDSLKKNIKKIEEQTQHCSTFQLNIMINYGSRQEIINGVNTILKKKPSKPITEEIFSQYLYTKDIPDPDILIRTSNEHRISNFLLWQISYSELYFHDSFWPDFSKEDLETILHDYQQRQRRFGGL